MAYENIESPAPNFCRSPVIGCWCVVDTSNPTHPTLLTKNESGGLVDSHSILGGIDFDGLLCIEYVGPTDLSVYKDGVDFIALERISDSSCIIKFMEINNNFKSLNLREEIILNDFAEYSFDAKSMAVEYDNVTISRDTPSKRLYIEVSDCSKIVKGMRLFIGPSTDPDSYGECEVVYVSSVVPISNRVYITSSLKNEYVVGNKVSFYKYIYLVSVKGTLGDLNAGSIIKIDPITKYIVNYDTDPVYRGLTLAKWCPYLKKIALLYTTNILYSDPYDYYTIQRSQFLGNFNATKIDFYDIYDIAFKDTALYKLSKKMTFKDSEGLFYTEVWDSAYNYQRDSLIPYVSSLNTYGPDYYTAGNLDTITLYFKAIDQFGVGLRDVLVDTLIVSGDTTAVTIPLSGESTTDTNGMATIEYKSGVIEYTGLTLISSKTYQGSPYTGSSTVVSTSYIVGSTVTSNHLGRLLCITKFDSTNSNSVKQLSEVQNSNLLRAFSFFSSQGGHWIPPYPESEGNTRRKIELLSYFGSYLGERQGLKSYIDNGSDQGAGLTLDAVDLDPNNKLDYTARYIDASASISNRLSTVTNQFSFTDLKSISNYFIIYNHSTGSQGTYPFLLLSQKAGGTAFLNLSQLFHSRHSYWMDGSYVEKLTTNIKLNQFIFVQDAIPAFWSRKNPTDTIIWLRLRPFAASLDATTLIIKIRQVSFIEDTGYVDISNEVTITPFDAGSNLLGLEVLYRSPIFFIHDATVYVWLSIRDVVGNLIKIAYWFTIVKDYLGPYLENLVPDINAIDVSPNTNIQFDIRDDGSGIDIDTLEVTINSLIVPPQSLNKVTTKYYRASYTPHTLLRYGTEVVVNVRVSDLADPPNWLNYGYRFYIKVSKDPVLTNLYPLPCTYSVSRFSDVSFIVVDGGDGVDLGTLRLQVHDRDVTDHPYTSILPIVYRLL